MRRKPEQCIGRALQLEHCAEGKMLWVVLSTSPSVPGPEPRTASNSQYELLVRQEESLEQV